MSGVACAACGAANSEFDPRCAACGAALPSGSLADPTLVDGAVWQGRAALAGDPLVGSRVSHFRVTGLVGRGGMGVVYRAMDLDLGREVALKFLPPHAVRPLDEARFRREAQAAAALDHPHIGTVYEVGEHGGRRFIAMALYEGETLAERLERAAGAPLPVPEVVTIAAQVASALAAAHGAGIVHRDLKPSNLMLTRDGRVKLLDFGLARQIGSPTLTEEGILVGTAAYMAPEQLGGEGGDQRADIWALGVLLYEMLSGGRPFGAGRRGLLRAILHDDPPPLRQVRPEIPPALAALVERCLEKDPGCRPSGGEILADLRAAGLVTGELGSSGATAPFVPPRHRVLRRWGAGLAAALLLVSGVAAFRLTRPPAPSLAVAVLAPEVGGTATAAQRDLVAANLQAAALRTLAAVEGITPLEPALWRSVTGPAMAVAKATAAQEVLATRADCTPDLCRVDLRRLAGNDGRVLWAQTLQIPTAGLRVAAEALAATLRQAYPGRSLRSSSLELTVDESDYGQYLDLLQRLEKERTEELLKEIETLRLRSPRFLELYYLEGHTAYSLFRSTGEARHLDRGLRVARQARELAPDDPRPLLNLVDLHLAAGRLDEAAAELTRLEGLEPASAALLLRKSRLAERRGDTGEALAFMQRAVERQPSALYLLSIAHLEYRLGRLDDARRHLEALLARAPDHSDGLSTLAQIELLDGDPRRAVEPLRRLARNSPGAPAPLTNLGVALMLLGRHAEAETVLRQALSLSPEDPAAALNLADDLWLLGRPDEARDLYRQVVERIDAIAAPPWMLLSTQALALAHLGESRRAVEMIQKALRESPDNAQLASEAARVYVLVGDRNSALVHAQKALEGGVSPAWFSFPWFDPLRGDPTFAALVRR
jgi:serine/threonine-protein kinase